MTTEALTRLHHEKSKARADRRRKQPCLAKVPFGSEQFRKQYWLRIPAAIHTGSNWEISHRLQIFSSVTRTLEAVLDGGSLPIAMVGFTKTTAAACFWLTKPRQQLERCQIPTPARPR